MRIKTSVAHTLGIKADIVTPTGVTSESAREVICDISSRYDAVVVQLPLPPQYNVQELLAAVPLPQDIDVLSSTAIEAFMNRRTKRIPPVAAAVWEVLNYTNTDIKKSRIVIAGKGKLVGEPIMQLFDREGVMYSAFDIASEKEEMMLAIANADIVITGMGQPHFLQPDTIKDGVILIDCGTSESAGKLAGDISPACYEKASFYTPVPGGIGPITVACLYRNLFEK